MIFGVTVVFLVVITFGVAGVLAGRHAQAAVQGFFPWSSPSALIRRASHAGCYAPVNNIPAPRTLLVCVMNIFVIPLQMFLPWLVYLVTSDFFQFLKMTGFETTNTLLDFGVIWMQEFVFFCFN